MIKSTDLNLNKGDIVLIPFPFTNLKSSKIRPAVVLNKNKSEDIIVAFISSRTKKIYVEDVLVKLDDKNRLKTDSRIICSKIAALDKKIVLGVLGALDEKTLNEINSKLLAIFDPN